MFNLCYDKVKIEVSNRHVHLSQEDCTRLIGEPLEKLRELSQKGEFLAKQRIEICVDDRVISHVAVVGPLRPRTQVEIMKSDAQFLELDPPLRLSGDLDDSEKCVLRYGERQIETDGVIIAKRHLHLSAKSAKEKNLKDNDTVSLEITGERGGRLDNIIVRVNDNATDSIHIDMDEANALNISKQGTEATLSRVV